MKKLFLILIVLVSAITTMAQSASFNFTAGAHSVSGWTNVSGDPSTAVRTGTASGIMVSSVATANWSENPSGNNSAYDGGGVTNGTFFPAAVMINHWYNFGAYTGTYNALMPQLSVTGLSKDSVYTLKMTGSFVLGINQYYTLNPIRYTVAGKVVNGFIDVNGDSNVTAGATFQNIAPDSTGKIRIYVNTYGGANVASVCGLQVITGHTTPKSATVILTSPANGTIFSEGGNVALTASATDTSGTIDRVDFYAGSTKIGSDSLPPFVMTWVNPDPGSYTLSAKAIDGSGNISTSSANIIVESLNYFWSTTGNIATSGDTFFVGTVDTNRLAFRTNNVERMTILKDGTIGIGTKTTYGYALAVNGTAIFTKAKVKAAGTWPDYVFKPDYKLLDLKDLECYLKEHQHLPDIAPEKTVLREGIDIAEQQAALLKKVEELTLYLIEQNKKIEAQQKEIDELKVRIKTKK
jgi:Bacterial Ig domain